MSIKERIQGLAATLRLPNVPSVWSNTLTGVIFATLIQGQGENTATPLVLLAILSATCLYFSGNLFNDWADLEWDREHRPERALPTGAFLPSQYLALGILMTLLGLTFAAFTSLTAMLVSATLVFFIILYTWGHKRTAWGVVPMALCRASLPILGFCACANNWQQSHWIFLSSAILFSYFTMLSLRARTESHPSSSASMSLLTGAGFLLPLLLVIGTPHAPITYTGGIIAISLSSLPYVVWTLMALTIFRKPIAGQISALLAGIPLLDALFLMPYLLLGHVITDHSMPYWLIVAWGPAFVAGRLLQRFIPAT